MPKTKPKLKSGKSKKSGHNKSGLVLSGSRVKRRLARTWGRKSRSGRFTHLATASIVETALSQLCREAATHTKPKSGDDPVWLDALSIAKAMADTKSVIHGLFPSKVAGVFTPSFKQ